MLGAAKVPLHSTFASAPVWIQVTGWGSRRLFQVAAKAELFLETLQHYRREGHYKLHAFVVMPDHIHLLLTPQEFALERVIQLIKGGFSHRLASNPPPLHPPQPRPRPSHRHRRILSLLFSSQFLRRRMTPTRQLIARRSARFPWPSARLRPSRSSPRPFPASRSSRCSGRFRLRATSAARIRSCGCG
jgi:putative transposase